MMQRMALHEFHPISESEIAGVPEVAGVYVLFQLQIPLHVDGAENLRAGLAGAKGEFPGATHFSVEAVSGAKAIARRVSQLRQELRPVRTATFVGSWPK